MRHFRPDASVQIEQLNSLLDTIDAAALIAEKLLLNEIYIALRYAHADAIALTKSDPSGCPLRSAGSKNSGLAKR